MGVFASPQRTSPWAQDPEALILLTLEVGRGDARLFDEVLDWLLANEGLISVRRLRALAVDDQDARLTDAALGWIGRQRPRARLRATRGAVDDLVPLFRRGGPIRRPDEDFARAGYRRSQLRPSGKSQPPDLRAPINFALRLRQILGVGARAEVVRLLLTTDAPRMTANALAQGAGYAKRNVHEALTALTAAGVVDALSVGSEQRYAARAEAWHGLLEPADGRFPIGRDWPQLFAALRRILRWVHDPALDSLSPYLTSSRTRDLLESLRPDLAHAGIATPFDGAPDDAWGDLTTTTNWILAPMMLPSLAVDSQGLSP